MSRFEDNLWAQLERDHAPALVQSLATQRRKRTRRWVGVAAGVAVLGAGALIGPAYFGGTPPAYAVVDNPDGSVTMTIREVQRFEEATAKLREKGIPAVAVPLRPDCTETGRVVQVPLDAVRFEFTAEASKVTVARDRLPWNAMVVVAADEMQPQSDLWLIAGGVYAVDQLPSCLASLSR